MRHLDAHVWEFDSFALLADPAAATIAVPVGFAADLRRARSTKAVLRVVAEWLMRLISAERASVTLHATEQYLRVYALEGNSVIPRAQLLPIEGSVIGRVVTENVTLLGRVTAGSGYEDLEMLAKGGLLSSLAAPLNSAGEVIGTINVASRKPCSYGRDDALVLTHIADLVAQEVAARAELEEAQELASVDPLTGAANRRSFQVHGDLRLDLWQSKRASFALGILDLDHFKELNDTFGHAAGDEVLQTVVKCLLANTRSDDLVARIGGEEFAVLIAHSDRAGAAMIFERMRRSIGDLHLDFGNGSIPLTVSVGVTCSKTADQNIEEVLQRADEALYRAKFAGRNRIEFADAD